MRRHLKVSSSGALTTYKSLPNDDAKSPSERVGFSQQWLIDLPVIAVICTVHRQLSRGSPLTYVLDSVHQPTLGVGFCSARSRLSRFARQNGSPTNMRLVRNNGYVKKRKRFARLAALGGFLMLTSSVALTFFIPALFIPGYALLIVGFITFNTGMQQITKWSRHPRPDEALVEALRRLNDRYTLIHFPSVGKGHPEHVLVYPGGLAIITTREVQGKIRVDGDRWHRAGGRLWALIGMSGPQLGNPTADNEREQRVLQSILAERGLPGEDAIDGIVAFLNPRAELVVGTTDMAVVTTEGLLHAVRQLSSETVLTTKDRDAIVATLAEGDNVEGPVSLSGRQAGSKSARAA